ncbi:hypothetical protein I7X12_14405 [Halosimplex litoreum]|uniref:Uncharacterized protein n=1 Tax=Halosimplex litoreum TaxID=1198301 RepID=A0A7T3FWA4_9EURY|nr:hypothetical protein [Halosimplex litoreum]QPV61936.1 hypothetical protein I7X12_14405 [Halosimplex litoreum]
MPRERTATACWLAALVVVGTLAAVVPAGVAAAGSSSPSAAPNASTGSDALAADDQSNSPYGNVVPTTIEKTDDATVAGGAVLPENYSVRDVPETVNGSIVRVEDGRTVWQRTFSTVNTTTQIAEIEVGPDGDVYAVVSTRPTQVESYPPETTTEVVHLTADGDLTWRYDLDTTGYAGVASAGGMLSATDQGVAAVHALPDGAGVRLAELTGGDAIWTETYDISAEPTTLRATDDGFLVAGTAGYSNPWVLQTSASGAVELNTTVRGSVDQRVAGAVPTDDGGVLLAGTQTTFGGDYSTNAWVSRLDDDGVTRWSRVYGTDARANVQGVAAHDGGVLLLERGEYSLDGETALRLRGVGGDGAQQFVESAAFTGSVTATHLGEDVVTLAGVENALAGNFTVGTATVDVPRRGDGEYAFEADLGPTSNETVYRGQTLRFADANAGDETYELLALPGERDEFEPHVVRRISFEDDEALLESATLPAGEYVLRNADGDALVLDEGDVVDTGDREAAAFELASQDFFHLETNRTFVDAAAGESGVSMSLHSDRTNYVLHASATDSNDESVSADELEAAFETVDGFDGVETVDGRQVARIEVGDDEEVRLNVSAAALDAGLYEVTVASPDTRDAGAVTSARVVVAQDADREIGVSLNRSSLTVPADGTAAANVTLTGVDNGITALSLSANRTGEPAVRPHLNLQVNASSVSVGAGIGSDEATTEATAFEARTGNGSVDIGTLTVGTDRFGEETVATGNNTITFRVDWVVDEDGTPYTVPGPITVPFEVVEATNTTDASGEPDEPDEGGVVGGGSDSGGSSDGGSESDSGSGSAGDSASGSSESGTATAAAADR